MGTSRTLLQNEGINNDRRTAVLEMGVPEKSNSNGMCLYEHILPRSQGQQNQTEHTWCCSTRGQEAVLAPGLLSASCAIFLATVALSQKQ